MTNTKNNIKRKRAAARRRKILAFFRMVLGIIILGTAVTAVGWISMQIYDWGSDAYARQKEIYNGYLQRKELRQASYDTRFDSYTNILVIGLDEGREDSGAQADSIVLLSLDNETGKMRFIIVPRYTITSIPGRPNPEALNNAYFYGGEKLVQQSVANLLGVTIHHYAIIDPKIISEVVNLLGGVDIYVENNMDYEDPEGDLYIHIAKGFQHMDGDTAQKYLRYRNDELGSVGRLHRQQVFLKALYQKMMSSDSVAKIPGLVDMLNTRINTTAELYDTADLVGAISNLDTTEPVVMTVPGELAANGSGAWVYDYDKTKLKIDELFPQPVMETEQEEEGWFNLW